MTQDPIEQALEKLGSYGVPVNEIGERVGGLVGQIGSLDPLDIMEQLGSIDPKQLDVGEMIGEASGAVRGTRPRSEGPRDARGRLRGRPGGEVDCSLEAVAGAARRITRAHVRGARA